MLTLNSFLASTNQCHDIILPDFILVFYGHSVGPDRGFSSIIIHVIPFGPHNIFPQSIVHAQLEKDEVPSHFHFESHSDPRVFVLSYDRLNTHCY